MSELEFCDMCNESADILRSERDSLKAELEIESEKYSILGADFCEIEADRDRWRSMAERLAEATRGLNQGVDWNNGTHAMLHGYRQKLIEALSAYNAMGKGDGE